MKGKIDPGDLVTITPATPESVEVGDIVLCHVRGNQYLHLVKAKDSNGQVQIANNNGHVNGWTKSVYGKVTKVESK